ncbi:hypothetical protein [Rhizobium sp.]
MSLEDFASYEETQYLLKDPRNAESLLRATADMESGINSRERDLIE